MLGSQGAQLGRMMLGTPNALPLEYSSHVEAPLRGSVTPAATKGIPVINKTGGVVIRDG